MTVGDEVAAFIIGCRGYLVVGIVDSSDIGPGDILRTFAHMELSQPIVLTQETNRADWDEQNRVTAQRFKQRSEVPRNKPPTAATARFFRAMTD